MVFHSGLEVSKRVKANLGKPRVLQLERDFLSLDLEALAQYVRVWYEYGLHVLWRHV